MDTQQDLQEWLKPFLSLLISETRRSTCSHYIASLLGTGLGTGLGSGEGVGAFSSFGARHDSKYDRLRHFVTSGVWEHQPLCDELARQANHLVGEGRTILVVGDAESSCESGQAVGSLHTPDNKSGNIQQFVSLTLVGPETTLPIALRLVLPGEWLSDASRLDRAEVPDAHRTPLSKTEIALQEIDRLLSLGVKFDAVIITGPCDRLPAFCLALTARDLSWVVIVPPGEVVRLLETDGGDGSAATLGLPVGCMDTTRPWGRQADALGEVTIDDLRRGKLLGLPTAPWTASDGEVHSDYEVLSIHLRHAGGTTVDCLMSAVSGRSGWLLSVMPNAIDQFKQVQTQLWREFRLNGFEGRTWQSQHRHMLLTMIAFAYSKCRAALMS